MTISIGSQIAEVERELRMRAKVYPRMAYGPGHTFARRSEADLATQIMEAVLETCLSGCHTQTPIPTRCRS